jgi:stress response protein SCP2
MAELAKGANAPLATAMVTIELHCAGSAVDLSALLLGGDGKVRSDDDMVFFNQPAAEDGAARHLAAIPDVGERIVLDLRALPASVFQVALVASCDPDDTSQTFSAVGKLQVQATQDAGETMAFTVPLLVDGERAVVLLEVYRRSGGWKVRAVGQGYANGLAGVATDFGVRVDGHEPPPAQNGTASLPHPVQVDLVKPPLGRVSLDKGSQASVSLDKADRELVVTATLEWDGGSDGRRRRGADLDLYALFVPADKALRGIPAGTVVSRGHRPEGQPIGPKAGRSGSAAKRKQSGEAIYYKRRGSLRNSPFIQLEGDSKVPGSEVIRIRRPDRQGYVLFCAYSALSNGMGSFRSFGAQVTVTDDRGSTVTVPLYENTKTRYWVAIALVDFTDPNGMVIRHIEQYSGRMTEKRPVLHLDGTIEMNAGPVEFKRR